MIELHPTISSSITQASNITISSGNLTTSTTTSTN